MTMGDDATMPTNPISPPLDTGASALAQVVDSGLLRCGVPPRAYLDLINSDPLVRVQRLGKRGLLHVAAEDADALGRRLEQGGAR